MRDVILYSSGARANLSVRLWLADVHGLGRPTRSNDMSVCCLFVLPLPCNGSIGR